MTISVSVFRSILYFAASQGADLTTLCQRIGIEKSELDDANKRFSIDQVDAAFYHCIELTKDSLFGLHIGEKVDFSAFGIVGFMMQSSPDVLTALERGCHYNNLVSELIKASFEKREKEMVFKTRPVSIVNESHPLIAKHGVEETMSFIVNGVQKLAGKKCYPQLVSFTFPASKEHINEYERIFRTTLLFNEPENALIYRLQDLEVPVKGYNKNLFDLLNTQAQELLDNFGNEESFSAKVRKMIISLFNNQFPTIELVAEKMNVSVRSLQRKLKGEEETFQELIDHTRKEFAIRYLKNKELTISEVAYLLGFSEPSVFSRSFKRWMGCSPTQYISE